MLLREQLLKVREMEIFSSVVIKYLLSAVLLKNGIFFVLKEFAYIQVLLYIIYKYYMQTENKVVNNFKSFNSGLNYKVNHLIEK